MKRILVLGGTHGNELLGVQLVALLKKDPIAGVDALVANPKAVRTGVRFTESDLNRSFGGLYKGTYETRRALRLKQIATKYDMVLDLHNTMTRSNDCSFVGTGCNPELYKLSGQLGLTRCIQATYDCINKACPNTLSVEVSMGGALDDARYWYKTIADLQRGALANSPPVERYKFLTRVTWQQAEQLTTAWRPFVRVSLVDRQILGIAQPVYPIFIGSKLTEYYATLLTKEEVY